MLELVDMVQMRAIWQFVLHYVDVVEGGVTT